MFTQSGDFLCNLPLRGGFAGSAIVHFNLLIKNEDQSCKHAAAICKTHCLRKHSDHD